MARPRKLKKLRINEVSAVDVGAGRGVRIVLAKRADGSVRTIEVPAPAKAEEIKMDKPKAILKRAAEYGDVDQVNLMAAAQRRACKAFPDATEPVAFAKFVELNPDVLQVLKAAPPAPAPAAPKSSFEAIARGAAEFAKKAGTVLPANSPYAPFLAKSDVVGDRDGADQEVIDSADLALRNIAQGLVDQGRFSSLAIAIRFVRNSPRYGSLARAGAGYKDAVRQGDRGMRTAGWR